MYTCKLKKRMDFIKYSVTTLYDQTKNEADLVMNNFVLDNRSFENRISYVYIF